MTSKKTAWLIFVFLAISVGLYPLIYLFVDMTKNGLLSTKPSNLLQNFIYNLFFFTHVTFGGIALLVGWIQFSTKIRNRNIKLHRILGKVYLISVLLSGLSGLNIAMYATGGLVSKLGFTALAFVWLYTSSKAFQYIKNKDIVNHQKHAIRSYALCFAAVTLRIWLPLSMLFNMPFMDAYRVIAWLCWIPNLIIVELLFIKKIK